MIWSVRAPSPLSRLGSCDHKALAGYAVGVKYTRGARLMVYAKCSREGLAFAITTSETSETIVFAALIRRVPRTPSYAQPQAHACPTMRIARCGNDSELTRPTRLPRAFVLRPSREHGLRFTEREGRVWVRLIRVVIVRGSRIRVGERWWHTAGYGGEWRWRRTTEFLKELGRMGMIASSGHRCR